MNPIKAKQFIFFYNVFIGMLFFWGCGTPKEETQFKLHPSSKTGITFSNELSYTDDFNVYKYRNFYNGGGIAVGDVNNDGLVDLYFTANQLSLIHI